MRKHFLLTFLLQSILIRSETMTSTTIPRDYSLIGREAQKAKDKGLASATWYTTPIPRKRMKELMRRSDQPAIRDTAIWLGLLMLTGGFGVYFWGTWWCVPFFFVYGILYGSASDSRWHECGHGTAFRTQWTVSYTHLTLPTIPQV